MDKLSERTDIVELGPEDLVIVAQWVSSSAVIQIKVYERKYFSFNPDPSLNHDPIARYSVCPSCFTQGFTDITNMYTGWAKINKTLPAKLIGIHNQDRNTLYIQFSLGQRYFVYERCPNSHKETVQEELFGMKHNLRLRALRPEDERFLIATLRFMPKAKKAISFYPHKVYYDLARSHSSLS